VRQGKEQTKGDPPFHTDRIGAKTSENLFMHQLVFHFSKNKPVTAASLHVGVEE
jgi:hypothetical protein